MGIQFKVSIPSGSLLERELEGRKGRQRQQRLYFLAELGAEQLKTDIQHGKPINSNKTDENHTINEIRKSNVAFPKSDLLSM